MQARTCRNRASVRRACGEGIFEHTRAAVDCTLEQLGKRPLETNKPVPAVLDGAQGNVDRRVFEQTECLGHNAGRRLRQVRAHEAHRGRTRPKLTLKCRAHPRAQVCIVGLLHEHDAYNLQNFAYGITDVSFGHYALYSAAFLFPGTAAYTVAAAGLVDEGQRLVCFAVAAVLLVATLVAARALKGCVQGQEGEQA